MPDDSTNHSDPGRSDDPGRSIDAESAEAFVRAYAKSQSRVLGFVQTLIPSQHDAEEVLQETSIVLWKKWPQYDSSKSFVAWACGIARFEVFRHLRQRPKLLHLSEEVLEQVADLAMEHAAAGEGQIDALKLCLSELPSKESDLLAMRYRRGIAVVDIAAEVGLARSTVFESLQKIRCRLMKCVERRIKFAEGMPL